jgi:hypothetical protein
MVYRVLKSAKQTLGGTTKPAARFLIDRKAELRQDDGVTGGYLGNAGNSLG